MTETIDRLTGMPYGNRDNSDAGAAADLIWTIDAVKSRAIELGKEFNPNPEIAERLEPDLANGALVLFTRKEVERAIEKGVINPDWSDGLINLVEDLNDIAVIPVENLNT